MNSLLVAFVLSVVLMAFPPTSFKTSQFTVGGTTYAAVLDVPGAFLCYSRVPWPPPRFGQWISFRGLQSCTGRGVFEREEPASDGQLLMTIGVAVDTYQLGGHVAFRYSLIATVSLLMYALLLYVRLKRTPAKEAQAE